MYDVKLSLVLFLYHYKLLKHHIYLLFLYKSKDKYEYYMLFLTILILFIFGGEVTRGFAFAMLIGVITGTYSSIFVAAPILVDLGKEKALTQPAATVVTDNAVTIK